jgi:hypothetical protein
MFVGLCTTFGGLDAADSSVSTYFTWSVSHAHLACAYANPRSLGATAAPLYPLVASGLAALARIGHGVRFPSSSALGAHCAHAAAAIYAWSSRSHALGSTLKIGYLGWLALAFAVVFLIRTIKGGPTRGEVLTLFLVAWAPPVQMCLVKFFHPQDLIAVALVLVGLSWLLRGQSFLAGVFLSLAFLTQQFALLAIVALVVTAPKDHRARLVTALMLTSAVAGVTLLVVTSGRAWESLVYGTGDSSWTSSLLVETGLRGNALFVTARLAPVAMTAITAIRLRAKWRENIMAPSSLLTLVTLSMLWRLVFEINLWGYYFMSVTVLLLLLEAANNRLRRGVLLWVVVASLTTTEAELLKRPWFDPLPLPLWQVVLVLGAFALVLMPLKKHNVSGGAP